MTDTKKAPRQNEADIKKQRNKGKHFITIKNVLKWN